MIKFTVFVTFAEIEEAKKKFSKYNLIEEKIREEALKNGLVIADDLFESVSIIMHSPNENGTRCEVTSPPEKFISGSKKRKKPRKLR